MENPGIDPGASRMRSGRSTNELIPQLFVAIKAHFMKYV